MGFVKMFWKNNVQDAYLPKISLVGQIVSDILPQLCFGDSIQILVNLAWVQTFRPKSYRPKNRTNSWIRDQKSNKHIADGYKKLFRAFVREAVQMSVPKKPLP